MDLKANKVTKRERGPNWEEDEKTIFFYCYQNVAKVLEDPKKDFNTNTSSAIAVVRCTRTSRTLRSHAFNYSYPNIVLVNGAQY